MALTKDDKDAIAAMIATALSEALAPINVAVANLEERPQVDASAINARLDEIAAREFPAPFDPSELTVAHENLAAEVKSALGRIEADLATLADPEVGLSPGDGEWARVVLEKYFANDKPA